MELKFREFMSVIILIGVLWRTEFTQSLTLNYMRYYWLLNINEWLLFSFSDGRILEEVFKIRGRKPVLFF